MEQQRVILESSPAFVLLCLVLSAGAAYWLYRGKHPWPASWNWPLTILRFILFFAVSFLLLGPIVRQISNMIEKPAIVFLYDNSASVKEAIGEQRTKDFVSRINNVAQDLGSDNYEVIVADLGGERTDSISFSGNVTDLNGALRNIAAQYEGRNIAGVILSSDGIFNKGLSPAHGSYPFPVYTIGVGDTSQRTDIAIRNVSYNRIAYQGNKFPVRVEVQTRNLDEQPVSVKLLQHGKQLEQQTKRIGKNEVIAFDFLPEAKTQGIQRLEIEVQQHPGEHNLRNNRRTLFIEVVEGKKKILVVAPSPHPDIKALRNIIEKNANYDFLLHIPGTSEEQLKNTKIDEVDLVVFHQSPDTRGRTNQLFQQIVKTKASLFFIVGQLTDLRTLAANKMPIQFEGVPRDFDQVTPVVNSSFTNFSLSPEVASLLTDFPPVSVHFGRIRLPLSATPLLYQRVGSVSTEKPLLAVDNQEGRKIGIMLGEGLWRWPLNEYDRTENTTGFDELFGKLIQFLSTTDEKAKFKSYPMEQDFADTEPVVFESQVYNDIFEPVYGNRIDIEVTDEAGEKKSFNYTLTPGNTRYEIGGLKEGIYKYRSRTSINNQPQEVRGEFAVIARQTELQNLTADFDLLRRVSTNTGGKFYKENQIDQLKNEMESREAKSLIHSEESFASVINLKWVFWLLVLIVSIEWFIRKFFGSY